MAKIHVIGRITNDLELKTSTNNDSYLRFGFAECQPGKANEPQYYQVWAWKEDANRLFRSGAKKGSLLYICGTFQLETYTKSTAEKQDKCARIDLDDWSFIPVATNKTS